MRIELMSLSPPFYLFSQAFTPILYQAATQTVPSENNHIPNFPFEPLFCFTQTAGTSYRSQQDSDRRKKV